MEPITLNIIFEGIVVGLLLIVVVYIVSFPVRMLKLSPELPEVCKTWNKNYVMEITLFLSGLIFHLLCEVSGVNIWYAKNKVYK